MKKEAVVGLALLLGFIGVSNSWATTYYGCFKCKYIGPTGIGETCDPVGALQGGDGWICHEDTSLPWPDGPICWVEGGACTNGGGGGGGGGTGGGGSNICQTSSFCPAECFSCSSGGGRPRI